ncbi:MAG: hypothetical protein PUE49_00020 [Eggerthellales bacterium]|nr:hypothetical protein [Eggerthellales bacterium]
MHMDCPWMDTAMDGAPEEDLLSFYQAIKWGEEPGCGFQEIPLHDERALKALGVLLAGAACVSALLLIRRRRNSHE